MSRGFHGVATHSFLSKNHIDQIQKIISSSIDDAAFQSIQTQLRCALTHYKNENSGQFLSWVHSESLLELLAVPCDQLVVEGIVVKELPN